MTTTTFFAPGDKVRVTGDSADIDHGFDAGTVGEVVRVTDADDVLVTTNPAVRTWTSTLHRPVCRYVRAADLEHVEEPPAAEPETPVLVDLARVQALHAARTVLGDAAERFDVVEVARFILGEGEGTVLTDTAPAVATVDTSEGLIVKDGEGDELLIKAPLSGDPDGAVAFVATDASGAYLTATDLDRVIAYLTALKG